MADEEREFWIVNSYGYPNPFNPEPKAQEAWRTFLSFFDFTSYADLKAFWASDAAPRRLSAHSVESWKATLEEFGLLYVLSRSGEITITPAGAQFRAAGLEERREDFAWTGLSLLLRYPLKGAPRGVRRGRPANSDLLLYWFLYAAILDLENTLWWTELERVLCTVFERREAEGAIDTVRRLRSRTIAPRDLSMVADRRGRFYNSLNQVIVHAGMNSLILTGTSDDVFYGESELPRRHWILPEWRQLVQDALGGADGECEDNRSFVARMPAAPSCDDERDYFQYLGGEVAPRPTIPAALDFVRMEGASVAILRETVHYKVQEASVLVGGMQPLCQLRRGQRIIVSHDLAWSYLVQAKKRLDANTVSVTIRRARPITNSDTIRHFLADENTHGRS
jgi:hypothetical protein